MQIKFSLDKGAYAPVQGHEADAGFDLRVPDIGDKTLYLYDKSSITIDTGVHFEIPKGYVGFLKSKSGLNVKYNIVSEGVIDAGYSGSVVVKLYNNGDELYKIKSGDKITQIVFLQIPEVQLTLTKEVKGLGRGDSGFGSTGR